MTKKRNDQDIVRIALSIAIICFGIGLVTAVPPTQPYTLYGTATLNGKVLTAQDDDVISLKVDGVELVSYTMGDIAGIDHYVLKVPIDSNSSVTTAAQEGDSAYIYINGVAINEGVQVIGAPAAVVQVDISATSASNPPSTPTLNDPGTTDTDGSYTVSWSSVSGATSYTLEEDTSSSFGSPTVVHSGAGTSKDVSGKSNGTYYYRVQACNAEGCSGWSNVEDIEVEISTGTVLTIVSYTISHSTITPPQTTEIDVAFSEKVSYKIAIENAIGTIYDWTGCAKDPQAKIWDGTYEADGTVVPAGDYTVNVTGTSTTTGRGVVNNTEVITVTSGTPSKVIYVPDDHSTIQAAVDSASTGDTIIVRDGIYTESIIVNKPHLTIMSENGAENCIVQAVNSDDDVFYVTTDYVNINGFTVIGATDTEYNNSVGILTGTDTTIDDCRITNCKQAIKIGADNCTIKNSVLSDNLYGIYAYKKKNHEICGNQILNSHQGLCLMSVSATVIFDNVIKNSTAPLGAYTPTGIYLSDTSNLIYNNYFIDNTRQAFVYKNRSNTWNTATIGNCWSDYNGTGYYVIDENNTDYHPRDLSFCFDTGHGTYPSIPGTHTGTITPNQDITVQKLYMYPCEGTGGHTESVRIYGNGKDESTAWTGYGEDGGTLTFDSSFTLQSGKTYNYVIETGSYPQIHHTAALQTETGWLNCTKFTDANGKECNDWIPAIQLFG